MARERIVNPSIGVRLPGLEPISCVPSVTAAHEAPTFVDRVQILGGVPSRWQSGKCTGLQIPRRRFDSGSRLQWRCSFSSRTALCDSANLGAEPRHRPSRVSTKGVQRVCTPLMWVRALHPAPVSADSFNGRTRRSERRNRGFDSPIGFHFDARSFNGRTRAFGARYRGSTPRRAAKRPIVQWQDARLSSG
jgi:hypothetical protein